MSRSLLKQKTFSTCLPRLKSYDFFLQVNIFLEKMCQKSKMDTTIDFVKTSFQKIIWNRRIITLIVRMIELHEKLKTKKKVLLSFKIFRENQTSLEY